MALNLRKFLPPKVLIDESVEVGLEISFSDSPILSASAVPPSLRPTGLVRTNLNPNNSSSEKTKMIHNQY